MNINQTLDVHEANVPFKRTGHKLPLHSNTGNRKSNLIQSQISFKIKFSLNVK